jgi:hypothetical protein
MKTWTRLKPVARKSHLCEICGRTIQPGETYMRGSGYGDGEAFTWKECAHCEPFAKLVASRLREEEYSFDLLAEWDEPKTVAEARVLAQWRRKWTNRAGDLYPVPTLVIYEDSLGFGWPGTITPGQEVAA